MKIRLADGLRWISPDLPVRVSGKSSISRARTRLGAAPFSALRDQCVAPLARADTLGAWYRGLRLVAFDGSTLNLPDEERNRETFGLPGASRGASAFPQARVTAQGRFRLACRAMCRERDGAGRTAARASVIRHAGAG